MTIAKMIDLLDKMKDEVEKKREKCIEHMDAIDEKATDEERDMNTKEQERYYMWSEKADHYEEVTDAIGDLIELLEEW